MGTLIYGLAGGSKAARTGVLVLPVVTGDGGGLVAGGYVLVFDACAEELEMRQMDVLAGMMGLLAVGVAAQQAGCVFNAYNDCEVYPHAGCPGVGTASSGTGGSTGTMSASGTGGSMDCGGDPRPGALGKGNINDDCAVFVRADAPAGMPDGTMAHPYKTLQEAIDKPKGARTKVFACKSMPFNEEVALATGLEVYGGFDCSQAAWTWAASGRTALDGPPGKVVLTIKNLTGDMIFNPQGDSILEAGHILIVVGPRGKMKEVKRLGRLDEK